MRIAFFISFANPPSRQSDEVARCDPGKKRGALQKGQKHRAQHLHYGWTGIRQNESKRSDGREALSIVLLPKRKYAKTVQPLTVRVTSQLHEGHTCTLSLSN